MTAKERRTMTDDEWNAEAVRRFGRSVLDWRFVCPACGHVAAVRDWQAAGAPEGAIAYSCVGRYLPSCREAFGGEGPGPCNYAGGGLFGLNPITVIRSDGKPHDVFAFAEVQP